MCEIFILLQITDYTRFFLEIIRYIFLDIFVEIIGRDYIDLSKTVAGKIFYFLYSLRYFHFQKNCTYNTFLNRNLYFVLIQKINANENEYIYSIYLGCECDLLKHCLASVNTNFQDQLYEFFS